MIYTDYNLLALAVSMLRAKYLLFTKYDTLHLQFYGCSATLISCDPVIAVTAAHCIPKVEQLLVLLTATEQCANTLHLHRSPSRSSPSSSAPRTPSHAAALGTRTRPPRWSRPSSGRGWRGEL